MRQNIKNLKISGAAAEKLWEPLMRDRLSKILLHFVCKKGMPNRATFSWTVGISVISFLSIPVFSDWRAFSFREGPFPCFFLQHWNTFQPHWRERGGFSVLPPKIPHPRLTKRGPRLAGSYHQSTTPWQKLTQPDAQCAYIIQQLDGACSSYALPSLFVPLGGGGELD